MITHKLGNKMGNVIEIGSMYVSLPLRVSVNDVLVSGHNDDTIAVVDNLYANIGARGLRNGISINDLRIDGMHLNIVRDTSGQFNYEFITDHFSSDGNETEIETQTVEPQSSNAIRVNNLLLKRSSVVYHDKTRDKGTEPLLMNYDHIVVNDINTEIVDFAIIGDTIKGKINRFSGRERSGFDIKDLVTEALVTPYKMQCSDLVAEIGQSNMVCDITMSYPYNSYFDNFNDSVLIDCDIKDGTKLMLTDIACFATELYSMPDLIIPKGKVHGYVCDFGSKDFELYLGDKTHIITDFSMTGLPYFETTQNVLDIKKMDYSIDDILSFGLPIESGHLDLPEQVKALGHGTIAGRFSGTMDNFSANFDIASEVGNVTFECSMNGDSSTYVAQLSADDINYGILAQTGGNEHVSLDVSVDGHGPFDRTAKFDYSGQVRMIDILDNTLRNIRLKGRYNNDVLYVDLNSRDEKLKCTVVGSADFSKEVPDFRFRSDLKNLDMAGLKIYDEGKNMRLATSFEGHIKGSELTDILGHVNFDTTTVTTKRGVFVMDSLLVTVTQDNNYNQKINAECDFFSLEAGGRINFKKLGSSFIVYLHDYIHFPKFDYNKDIEQQNFYVYLKLHDASTLTDLLIPELEVAEESQFGVNFATQSNDVALSVSSNYVKYKNIHASNLLVYTDTQLEYIDLNINVEDFTFKEPSKNDTTTWKLENIDVNFVVSGDSLYADASWDDDSREDMSKGDIKCSFSPYRTGGGIAKILSSDMTIDSKKWHFKRNGYVEFADDRTRIHDLEVRNNNQIISIEGYYPKTAADNLSLTVNDFDISTLDPIFSTMGLNFNGLVNGYVNLSDLQRNLTVDGDVSVDGFAIKGKNVGDAFITSSWNNSKAALSLDATITDDADTTQILSLSGRYFPRLADSLDFNLNLNKTRIEIFEPFMTDLVSDVTGDASGEILITGNLSEPVFNGIVNMNNAQCRVDYLNTYYSFSHPVEVSKNLISIQNLILFDNDARVAIANGTIRHNYLRDFYFDVSIRPNNFLCMNTTEEDNPYYYGSIKATGDVRITGPLDNINMSIDARTDQGTRFVLPTDYVSSVGEKNYIQFVSHDEDEYDDEEVEVETIVVNPDKDIFTMDIAANVTERAKVSIILPDNIGTLDATGSGNLNMNMNASEEFSLVGDYVINSGKFVFSPLNFVIKKSFDIMDGGVISWTGDPLGATIDVNGVYKTKTSIATLGLTIDSTTNTSSSVNVNCIINLSGQLSNPDVMFRIELPNASEDITQTVFTQIDTTSQSIVLEQVLSLLVFNTFTNTNNTVNNSNLIASGINVITAQINSWLSQISNGLDINFRYSPNSMSANEEVEFGLKKDMFNNRLTIEGNLGIIGNQNSSTVRNYSNIVGDVNISCLLTADGRLKAMAYNHSNTNTNYYIYTYDNYSPYTQGVGLSYTREFNNFKDLFRKKRKIRENYEEPTDISDEFNEKFQGL